MWTIVVAGGSGSRLGRAKQFEPVGEARMVDHSVTTACAASAGVVLVVPAADVAGEAARAPAAVVVVAGGASRSASVRAGLAAVPDNASIVCVHDAARPFASGALFEAVVAAVRDGADGAVPAVPVTDTIKVVDARGRVQSTPERATLVAVQTPQAFRRSVLAAAHETGDDGTDDAALVERAGGAVIVVAGEDDNRKITHLDDLEWARTRKARQ